MNDEPPLVLPLWIWDRGKHRPHGVCERPAELAGTVEQTDSLSLNYILIDGSGYRYVVETNERLVITRFERLDASPIDSSLELLFVMQAKFPSRAAEVRRKPRWRF